MRIISWNVNSLRARLDQVERLLEEQAPDVLVLQETKLQDPEFPAEVFLPHGYRSYFAGQKSYNGVALLARSEVGDLATELPVMADPQRRVIAGTVDGVRVIGLYVPNGQEVGSDKYEYKLEWLGHLRDWLEQELVKHPQLVVTGDFNIAPDDRDVHDPELWRDRILCSDPERAALAGLTELGLRDSFRMHHQEAGRYSWWDYRSGGFDAGLGLRIDLALISPALADRCSAADILSEARGWERPSDHAPVLLDLD